MEQTWLPPLSDFDVRLTFVFFGTAILICVWELIRIHLPEKKMTEIKFIFENGTKVKSNITGFAGMIIGRADHIHGCNRYMVQPPVDKENKLADAYWFDEMELELIEEPAIKNEKKDRGGPASKVM